jgi:hypothetical protein
MIILNDVGASVVELELQGAETFGRSRSCKEPKLLVGAGAGAGILKFWLQLRVS